ncbi:MAG: gluconate 2-dehydrogenase subunit 3 family protein, partial [Longimicrobiales bacterium]
IDELAQARHGVTFAALTPEQQDDILRSIQRGEPREGAWARVPPARFFRNVLCAVITKTYYAHPAAWSECGYNGPSSPRGHVRKWIGGVDPWEAQEAT